MSRQAIVFSVISGLGWIMDVCLTTVLVSVGVSPFFGSCIGAGTAVTFVYVASRSMVFGQSSTGQSRDFAIYVTWQIFAIATASLLVAWLAGVLTVSSSRFATFLSNAYGWATYDGVALATGASKILVTPLTLAANFVFMRWLTQRGDKSVRPDGLKGQ